MIIFGYVKATKYTGDGTLTVQTRIPNVHGPYRISDAKGKTIRNYIRDDLCYTAREGRTSVLRQFRHFKRAYLYVRTQTRRSP